jgi:hypothetical protein
MSPFSFMHRRYAIVFWHMLKSDFIHVYRQWKGQRYSNRLTDKSSFVGDMLVPIWSGLRPTSSIYSIYSYYSIVGVICKRASSNVHTKHNFMCVCVYTWWITTITTPILTQKILASRSVSGIGWGMGFTCWCTRYKFGHVYLLVHTP